MAGDAQRDSRNGDRTHRMIVLAERCPEALLDGLRRRGAEGQMASDEADVMAHLAEQPCLAVIVAEPEHRPRYEELREAIRTYYPRVACWRYEPAGAGLVLEKDDEIARTEAAGTALDGREKASERADRGNRSPTGVAAEGQSSAEAAFPVETESEASDELAALQSTREVAPASPTTLRLADADRASPSSTAPRRTELSEPMVSEQELAMLLGKDEGAEPQTTFREGAEEDPG